MLSDLGAGVIGAEGFLVDVLFKNVTEHVRVNLVVLAPRRVVKVPGIAVEQVEEVLEGAIRDGELLLAKLEDGKVYYYLDVPREAPTVRGYAGILCEGLNGALPEEIAAIPNDLYQRMGLHKVLSPLRLRGLTGLLGRMKRNAQQLASTT